MTITEEVQAAILQVSEDAWMPAYNGDGQAREGAWARAAVVRRAPVEVEICRQLMCHTWLHSMTR